MACGLSNFNGASLAINAKPKLLADGKPTHRSTKVLWVTGKQTEEFHQSKPPNSSGISLQPSRRASLGLAVVTLLNQFGVKTSHADEEGNGLWLTGPLPVPSVTNKIANEETGTRSFLRKGIYMANIGAQGSAYRLKHYAFDLLGLGDLMGQDAWSYIRKYLCLKSTFMYYDFDKVISAATDDQKQPLTDLANRLFDSVEKLEDAVKKRSEPMMQSCYADTTVILQEVMARMA